MPHPSDPSEPPARAFTQGVGTVFQFSGVILFVCALLVCCGSSLISREGATHSDFTRIGWSINPSGPAYSAQRALTICLPAAVFFGLATAGLGLGLQAQNRRSPLFSVILTAIALLFWLVHSYFFMRYVSSVLLMIICLLLACLFAVLMILACAAWREMYRNPPPGGFEILPSDYKIPYSHMHQDPPEVRLAREVEQRRQRLQVQQKELEMLEEKLKRKLQQSDE